MDAGDPCYPQQAKSLIKDVECTTQVYNIKCVFDSGILISIDGTITFSKVNLLCIAWSHENALILTLSVVDYDVCCIPIDQESSIHLLHIFAYKQMNILINALESLRA